MIIDANIFLEVFLNQEKIERCRTFLNKTAAGEVKAVVSDFTIDTVLLSMERNSIIIQEMKEFLLKISNSKGVRIYPINMRDRIAALKLIDRYNLDYEDALVLQSAIATNSKEIISFDKHFDKVKEIKRIEP